MRTQGPVVVGVDGSAGADAAVRWAIADASTRKAAVRLVCVYRTTGYYQALGMYTELPQDLELVRRAAKKVLDKALADAASIDPGVELGGTVVDGNAVSVLMEESERASLLVLGSRQRSTLTASLLGSVSGGVAARADCPVIVVRAPAGLPAEHAEVVVGVDGTEASQALLEFGFDHASRRQAPLRAVLCWHPDLLASMLWRPEPPAPARAEAWLSETLAGWREKFPEVAVRSGVVREHPADGLTAESAAAQLLVVGTRGRHAMAGTLLGSVSQAVLHHATCPVAVVPTQSL